MINEKLQKTHNLPQVNNAQFEVHLNHIENMQYNVLQVKLLVVMNGSFSLKRTSADRKEEMKTDNTEFVRQQQHMMLQKALLWDLERQAGNNKREVKMEWKNHDKISIRLSAFFGCQQQLDIQCTLLAEQLAIKEECVVVSKNLKIQSRSNQAGRD